MPSRRVLVLAVPLLFLLISLAACPPLVLAQSHKSGFPALPLEFEVNAGQVPAAYDFLARRGSMQLLLRPDGADVVLSKSSAATEEVRLRWIGANAEAVPVGENLLPGRSNYLRGSDSSKWLRNVAQYSGVRYPAIYPGVDLLFHGHGDNLEHDFVLQPGADPAAIAFRFDKPVQLNKDGDLLVRTGAGDLHFLRPIAYQISSSAKTEVSVEFVVAPNGDIHFKLGPYDSSAPLIIDPVISFATYLDGTNADAIQAVTTDGAGNVYVTGYTRSVDFPVTNSANPLCSVCLDASQTSEAFISKLDPTGHTLLYSTYLGGSTLGGGFGTFAYSIALDKSGNIYVAGVTSSEDFPHVGAVIALDPANYNANYYFVASLKPDGSALNYSGLVGGEEGSTTNAQNGKLAIDGNGNAYLAGTTDDPHFQLTPGTLDPTPNGYPNDRMFTLKLDITGKLVWSTLVPGNAAPVQGTVYANNFTVSGITVDSLGQVTATGLGGAGLPATPGVLEPTIPAQSNNPDPSAAFLLQLNATASALNFATYLPGADNAYGLAKDSTGNFYITGNTSETNLPVSANAYQKTIPAASEGGYIMKVNSAATTVLAATYLSGGAATLNPLTNFIGVALDSQSNVMVVGWTSSTDFPLVNPLFTIFQTGETDVAFVAAQLKPDLSSLLFSTFLSSTDQLGGSLPTALTFDANDNAIVTGTTFATDFPTTTGSYQPTPPSPGNSSTYQHTFIAKLNLATPSPSLCFSPAALNFGAQLVGTPIAMNLSITNCGNAALQISSVASSSTYFVAGSGCRSIAAAASCNLAVTFTPTSTTNFSGTLTFTDYAGITQQVVTVSGTGGEPQVYFPPSVAVDDLVLGTHAETYLLFQNSGNANWLISSVTATGDFAVDNLCPSTVPAFPSTASFCNIGVIFTPTALGIRTGTLTITDNIPGSPHVIALSGNSLASYPTPSLRATIAVPSDATMPQLQLAGTNFFPTSQVLVNGSPRTTGYAGQTSLVANLTDADIAQAGELTVTVMNPAPGGGVSNSALATIYVPIRNIAFKHTVFDPNSGHLFSSVDSSSPNYPGQVLVIDPATAKVLNAWTVGGGPNQLALSDDGQFLYAGLDTDKTVAQVAVSTGTVNFAVSLGVDPTFQLPLVADALRVLPGQPHAWAVTLCGTTYTPCGAGVAVFDDAVERANAAMQSQLQPDSLLFIGQNAATLYGTTLNQGPSTFYEFAITSTGISLTQSVTNFSAQSPGGGTLDTDGTSIYVSNGELINPTTLAVESAFFSVVPDSNAFRVDVPASRVYFEQYQPTDGFFATDAGIAAYDLTTQKLLGQILLSENNIRGTEMYRWGTNGLALSSPSAMLLFRSSITGSNAATPSFFVSGLSPVEVMAGSPATAVTVSGGGFAAGDSVLANGAPLTLSAITPTQFNVTLPAALLSVPGDVQLVISDTSGDIANLVLTVTPEPTSVSLSTNVVNFAAQPVSAASSPQTVTLTNSGSSSLTVSSITATGDFSQTNTCSTVTAGGNCTISVVFTPTATGNRSGTLQINDNDVTKMQTVALSGIGTDLQITGTGASGTSATVSSGQSATYNLSIATQGGFTGQVSFACMNLPQYASCTFSPSSATLASAATPVIVTIATTQAGQLVPVPFSTPIPRWPLALLRVPAFAATLAFLAALLLLLGQTARRHPRFGTLAAIATLTFALVALPMAGCGGGGGGGTTPPANFMTAPGTYTVNFVVSNAQILRSLPLTLVVK